MSHLTTPSLSAHLATQGRLRAAINLGNPILAYQDGDTVRGVSVDLAEALAHRLRLDIELVVVHTAAESVAAVREQRADVGFFAVDPARGEGIAFTAPYVLIEGSYLVQAASPLQSNDDVDQPGTRVVVGQGSAYDLYLSRTLKQATIVRAPSSPAVVPHFMEHGLDVAAGVKQQLEADQQRFADLRLLPGRFMVIQQAMGLSTAVGDAAASELRQFVEDMKASGYVAEALARHGVQGASVAPAAAG